MDTRLEKNNWVNDIVHENNGLRANSSTSKNLYAENADGTLNIEQNRGTQLLVELHEARSCRSQNIL